MKAILKATFAAALAAAVFNAVLGRLVARQAGAVRRRRLAEQVPTMRRVIDAEPYVAEPLQESDLRIAQNSPL